MKHKQESHFDYIKDNEASYKIRASIQQKNDSRSTVNSLETE